MDLNPSDEQQQLIEAFGALYAKESAPERVRAAEPLGFDRKLWDQLLETGVGRHVGRRGARRAGAPRCSTSHSSPNSTVGRWRRPR